MCLKLKLFLLKLKSSVETARGLNSILTEINNNSESFKQSSEGAEDKKKSPEMEYSRKDRTYAKLSMMLHHWNTIFVHCVESIDFEYAHCAML